MKKTIVLILAAMTLLALAACQTTPDEEFVVQKDTERMVQQAADDSAGTKVSKLKVPDENYTYSTSAANGKLTISVDAPVSVPKSEKIPTARVSEAGFTQEEVTGFFNYFFPDGQAVTYNKDEERVLTKDEIEQLILTYKQYIAEGTVMQNTLYDEDELEEEIENLKKQYESAPETAPTSDAQISDGTMTQTTVSLGDVEGEDVLELKAGTEDERLHVSVPVDENGSCENYLMFAQMDMPSFFDMNAVKINETDWSTAAEGKLTISYEDAKALCDDFFEANDIMDAALSDAFIIDDEYIIDQESGQVHDPENYAYQFNYVRTVSDSKVANMSYVVDSAKNNSLPWDYEDITIWVSDRGIEYISWQSHTTTGEIINEDTGVIDFEEACEIFETMIVTTYGTSEVWPEHLTDVRIDIDDIELSLVRIREQNVSGRSGIYTPAWVFYGNVIQELSDYDTVWYGWNTVGDYPPTKYPVLVINAIDGNIIDMDKGY